MSFKTAVLPGSFDPVTNGHLDIIRRSASLVDSLYILVGENINKKNLFSAQQRKRFVEESVSDLKNVKVIIWNGLITDFLKENDVSLIIKGVRDFSDFNNEASQCEINRLIYPSCETLLMPSSPAFFHVSSSTVKEMAQFGADVSSLVPPCVNEALLEHHGS